MVQPGRERLHRLVEVDETYLDQDRYALPPRRKKSSTNKTLVAIAIEMLEPKGLVVFAYNDNCR